MRLLSCNKEPARWIRNGGPSDGSISPGDSKEAVKFGTEPLRKARFKPGNMRLLYLDGVRLLLRPVVHCCPVVLNLHKTGLLRLNDLSLMLRPVVHRCPVVLNAPNT